MFTVHDHALSIAYTCSDCKFQMTPNLELKVAIFICDKYLENGTKY